MTKAQKAPVILLVEDDEDDYLLTLAAFRELGIESHLKRVKNGEELMRFLNKSNAPAGPETTPKPSLILLDLNMPKMDGHKALSLIKSDPDLRRIPVTILTTSQAPADILETYQLGGNSFIQKAVSYRNFVEQIKIICKYWLDIVKLPN